MENKLQQSNFFKQAIALLHSARQQVVTQVNAVMVHTYFEIGRMIVEKEQQGKDRADYGKGLLKGLSESLTKEFGRGFSIRNIEQMRKFYLTYSKTQTLFAESDRITQTAYAESKDESRKSVSSPFKLSWSHYLKLMRIEDENERKFYEIESVKNSWSVRELDRQYNTALYTRLVLSRDQEKTKELSEKGLVLEKPVDLIKDPYILEFIGLPEKPTYSENDLEQGIIDKLEHFLLELGTGFTFVARQKRISFDDKHFF